MIDTRHIAADWLVRHARDLGRIDALRGCADHLAAEYGLDADTAETVALQALARLEGRNQRAWIDVADTTAHVVVIRRTGQRPLALTVTDLLRLHRHHSRLH